jgi:hypothetical protein
LKTSLVITTISPPNAVLHECAVRCREHGIDFIVIGDRKSPPDFILEGCDYWSIDRQLASGYSLARQLPEGHYSRKNLGYLLAMERGAEVIIETDDDNLPGEEFWQARSRTHLARKVSAAGWVNPYCYFTDKTIWPRGFPLEEIRTPAPATEQLQPVQAPVQQGLTDGEPDVDAIFRLTNTLPVTFRKDRPLALGNGSLAPFNSQNTTWFREAFPLLYLPSTCSFRMTDIWRSFIAKRICDANGWELLFHGATVFQERNQHDLLTDFKDEIPGYLHNAQMCRDLASLPIKNGIEGITEGLVKCYELLITRGLFDKKEDCLLKAWLSSVSSIIPAEDALGTRV